MGNSGRLTGFVLICGVLSFSIAGQNGLSRQKIRQLHSPPAKSRPNADLGRATFESTCAACHGLDGRGGERGPDIATRQQVVQLSDAQTLAVLRNGKVTSGMPGFGALGTVKLRELLAYLRMLQGKEQITVVPGDAAKGKILFFGKAGCSECHMMHGEGGFLGRELTAYGISHAPGAIRSSIAEPKETADNANHMVTVTLRNAREIRGVIRNQDNFSIQLQSPDGTFHFLSRTDIQDVTVLPDPIMPTDYGKTLTPAELDDLVSYLLKEAGGKVAVSKEPEVEE